MILPGLYGLASLDGAPLDAADLHTLSLAAENSICETALGLVVCAVEYPFETSAVSVFRGPNLLVVFAGYLDEPDDLAGTLGLAADTTPVALAMAAVERFGKNAPTEMLGGWSLLRWEADARRLTLITSERTRDAILFVRHGGKLAFAPDTARLCRLPWVGRELDPVNFPLSLSVARLRHILGDRTMWKNVLRVMPQSTEVFTAQGRSTSKADPLPEPELWQGSYQDALDASDALGRRIVRQHLARYRKVGLLLSGGLDSTLVATWMAAEAGAATQLFCVTSVPPPGLGPEVDAKGESEYACAVAEHLGLDSTLQYPEPDRSAYVPSAALYEAANSPILDLRHYVSATMYEAVAARGACAVMTGSGGEWTVTDGHFPPRDLAWPLRLARDTRTWLRRRRDRGSWPQSGFFAPFSAPVYAGLPRDWEKIWRAGAPQGIPKPATEPRGTHPSLYKTAGAGTATFDGMRGCNPLTDPRFLRLGARMPATYTYHDGLSRAMARNMLKGKIPEFVRLRYKKAPFGPDYEARLARQAGQTRERLKIYLSTDVGRWLDLKAVEECVSALEPGVDRIPIARRFDAHLGILIAEFLAWNHTQR